jgi:riboflavin biosynthesis pyrimidine reductase
VSTGIDETIAWALLREIVPGSLREAAPVRVTVDGASGPWLEVRADGSWEASEEVDDAARKMLDIFVPVRIPAHLVIGQLGQSLDGRIATESGASHYVTGEDDIERLHRLRALVDAVIVGASTVAQDDPRLTVRLVEGKDPVRVVLDPSGRLDSGRQVFAAGAETLVIRGGDRADAADVAGTAFEGEAASASRVAAASTTATRSDGSDVLRVPWSAPDRLDLAALIERLAERGLRRILVEGGGLTVSRFLSAGLLDRLHVAVAPMLIGSGRPSVTLDPVTSLDQALRPATRRFTLGEDVLFDLDLRTGPR